MKQIVNEVVNEAGGAVALALELGITHQAIYQWQHIPVNRVVAIEAITGIPRSRLRPDLYGTVGLSILG